MLKRTGASTRLAAFLWSSHGIRRAVWIPQPVCAHSSYHAACEFDRQRHIWAACSHVKIDDSWEEDWGIGRALKCQISGLCSHEVWLRSRVSGPFCRCMEAGPCIRLSARSKAPIGRGWPVDWAGRQRTQGQYAQTGLQNRVCHPTLRLSQAVSLRSAACTAVICSGGSPSGCSFAKNCTLSISAGCIIVSSVRSSQRRGCAAIAGCGCCSADAAAAAA